MNRSPHTIARAVALLLAVPLLLGVGTAPPPPEVRIFIQEMEHKYGLERAWLEHWLGRARRLEEVVRLIQRPAEGLPWHRYRDLFLTPKRVRGGNAFWGGHAGQLRSAWERYGVPPSIVTAILGVETFYGGNTGRHQVLDVLYTLTFHYPPRAKYFRGELGHFLLLVKDAGLRPDQPRGSYAGAMGLPQFMPSSYRNYAVALDDDGSADIWSNPGDAVASIANYLKQHGWRSGAPVLLRLDLDEPRARALSAWFAEQPGRRPTLAAARAKGLLLPPEGAALDGALRVMFVELELRDGREYWLGLPNFYVLTRYNHSRLYVAAVWFLAEAIRAAYGGEAGS